MRRTNSYDASFPTSEAKRIYCEFAAASDCCYNEINYRRHQAYFNPEKDVYDVDVRTLREDYVPIIGSGTFDQLERENRASWNSYFRLKAKYEDPDNNSVTDRPGLPGYWGNRREGYPLRTLIRNDLYEFKWGAEKSTLEFTIGKALKEKYGYGYYERLRLEVHGVPRWEGKNGQVELWFDEEYDTVRVRHVVKQPQLLHERGQTYTPTRNANQSTASRAAIDVGANNTITVATDAGDAVVFQAHREFNHFHSLTKRIADAQSKLPPYTYSSVRIRRLYDTRSRRRDHHRDTAVRYVAEWLVARGVEEVVVGDLRDVLSTHWSARVNEKTHAFWSHGQLSTRLEHTFEEVGLLLGFVSEAGSSSTCPECQSENVDRDGDRFDCLACGYREHSDVVGARNLLAEPCGENGSMARPATDGSGRASDGDLFEVTYLQWDDHSWTAKHEGHSTNEAFANP